MQRAKRARAALVWVPSWGGTPKQWAAGYIKRNKWRVDRVYDFDDLMQEAHIIFLKIAEKYPRVIEPRNFMGLYKRALENWFNDRACDILKSRRGSMPADLIEPLELSLGQTGELRHAGELAILLSEAPQELRLALGLLTDHPDFAGVPFKAKEPPENLNMKLRRILGLDEKFDLKAALTELLFN